MSENQPMEQSQNTEADISEEIQNFAADLEEAGLEPEFEAGLGGLVESVMNRAAQDPQPGITVNPASFTRLTPNQNGQSETGNLDMLLDIGLQVTVELGRTKMTIKKVLSLGPGTVVELNRVAGDPVDVLINGKAIAKGEVVVIGDMFGVRVTDIIPPAQRVETML